MIKIFTSVAIIIAFLIPKIGLTQENSWTLMQKGDYYGAIKYIEEEIGKGEKGKDKLSKAILPYHYIGLAGNYLFLGLPHQGLAILKQNESKIEKEKALIKLLYLGLLADFLGELRRNDEMFLVLNKMKEIIDTQTNPDVALQGSIRSYYSKLGSYYYDKHEYDKAVSPFIEASKLVTEIESRGYNPRARLSVANNPLIISLYKTHKLDESKSYLKSYTDSAIYYQLKGNFEQSLEDYSRHLLRYKNLSPFWKMQISLPEGYYGLLCLMGKPDALQTITDRIAEEETVLKDRFISFSEKEKKSFIKKYSSQLNLYYSALLYFHEKDKQHTVEFLEKSLQTKGLIMDITQQQKALVREAKFNKVLGQQYQLASRLRNKVAALSQVNGNSDSLANNATKLSILERKINESLKDKISILPNISWKQIKQRLSPNESFVNIVRIERDDFLFNEKIVQYYAFIIKADSEQPQMIKLGEGDMEGRLFKQYQNSIRSQLEDVISYDHFWLPVASSLKGVKKVYLSADGIYNLINISTLLNTDTKKYLIDEVEIARVNPRDFMLSDALAKNRPSTISLVGNPNFTMKRNGKENLRPEAVSENYILGSVSNLDRAGLTPLPGTQKEIELIALQAKSSGLSVDLYKESTATEKNVKKISNPSVLHLATHGQFNRSTSEDSYLQSKLILAGAGDEEIMTLADYEKFDDGLLTAFEVIQMELDKTELIVLSACETSLGEVQNGEGVWGLQRAFQLAGAKSVMGSLWKISDEATVTYMNSFYKSYLSGASPSQAYQSAMSVTKAKYPHPYYWGAFILSGN